MARVNKGNTLNGLALQPGWTIENDGFGLLTSRLVFVTSHSQEDASSAIVLYDAPQRGDAHPKDRRLTCHRASVTVGGNGLATISAEYIGIASGNMTTPEVSGRGNMSTDPITTHPDFVTKIGGTAASPLNGAQFQSGTDLFVGFKYDSTAEFNKEGVRSFLNPGFGISGHFYTTDISVCSKLRDRMGTTSGDGKWVNINLLGGISAVGGQATSVWGNWVSDTEVDQLLLTGVAIDFFGTVIKVSYDITFARYGWDRDIYKTGAF